MSLSVNERNVLINYRLEQAAECVNDVSFLIINRKFKLAVNRIYYGIFYSLLALALAYKFETSKHIQLIGWFNKNFIHTKLIDLKFGKLANKAFTLRNEADYEPFIEYSEPQIKELFETMKEFINEIKIFILNENNPKS